MTEDPEDDFDCVVGHWVITTSKKHSETGDPYEDARLQPLSSNSPGQPFLEFQDGGTGSLRIGGSRFVIRYASASDETDCYRFECFEDTKSPSIGSGTVTVDGARLRGWIRWKQGSRHVFEAVDPSAATLTRIIPGKSGPSGHTARATAVPPKRRRNPEH